MDIKPVSKACTFLQRVILGDRVPGVFYGTLSKWIFFAEGKIEKKFHLAGAFQGLYLDFYSSASAPRETEIGKIMGYIMANTSQPQDETEITRFRGMFKFEDSGKEAHGMDCLI